jgi:hypothetical protein
VGAFRVVEYRRGNGHCYYELQYDYGNGCQPSRIASLHDHGPDLEKSLEQFRASCEAMNIELVRCLELEERRYRCWLEGYLEESFDPVI